MKFKVPKTQRSSSSQTIFEINSTSKTQASEVMRAKRSKDAQLVDKFNKQRDQMAAESPMLRPVKPTAVEDDTHSVDGEEVDLKVRNSIFCIRMGVTVSRMFGRHRVKLS